MYILSPHLCVFLRYGYRQDEVDRLGRGMVMEGQTQLF